ncbi:hypothetical protein PV08_07172 [Exophiala spinifera]|uniref:Uncharacterized protein n=1 Tax=Exophiala spinifera TaxID=91928 RepID=A0A0D2B6T3_9EURO|nr:uncharacterized protein PV08_07172 [Exophiala spinifera]KIW14390.1 hypothetical protein PV08_07172 [Exophiala spinifera]
MSVTVKHLNADSTFLLLFSPEPSPTPADLTSAGGAFGVLIDPWLNGPSIVTAPWFARTEHQVPSAIQHLSEIEAPDVVVVSQKKTDHCHKETLLQLPPEARTVIVAEPAAAKVIRSWAHFDPHKVHGLLKYDPKVKFGRSFRVSIPPLGAAGFPGEVTISFVPAKNYMTGLHNAFGITYQPPTRTKSLAPIATVDLPKMTKYFHMPLSPMTVPPSSPSQPLSPLSVKPVSFDQPREAYRSSRRFQHRPHLSRSSNTASSELLPAWEETAVQINSASGAEDIIQQTLTMPDRARLLDIPFQFDLDQPPGGFNDLPTPPHSPSATLVDTSVPNSPRPSVMAPPTTVLQYRKSMVPRHHKSLSSSSSTPCSSPITPPRPKALSVIYSPHGVALSDLQPYVQHHLVQLTGALPLTLLLHSFDRAENPWFLGGNIMTGMEGGAEIARALMARCWISAHDEAKDDRGVSVKALRVRRITAPAVQKHLWEGEQGAWLKRKGWMCDVRSLDSGKDMLIGPVRDLCSGMEGKRESRLLRFGPEEVTPAA